MDGGNYTHKVYKLFLRKTLSVSRSSDRQQATEDMLEQTHKQAH